MTEIRTILGNFSTCSVFKTQGSIKNLEMNVITNVHCLHRTPVQWVWPNKVSKVELLLKILLRTVQVFHLSAAKLPLAAFLIATLLELLTHIHAPIMVQFDTNEMHQSAQHDNTPGEKQKSTGKNTGSLPYSHSCQKYKLVLMFYYKQFNNASYLRGDSMITVVLTRKWNNRWFHSS